MPSARFHVSATAQDLGDVRDYVVQLLQDLGHTVNTRPFHATPDRGAAEAHLAEVRVSDALVLMLGNTSGPSFPGSDKDVAQVEYEVAKEAGIRTFVLVREATRTAYSMYLTNGRRADIGYHVDQRVLQFLDLIQAQEGGSVIQAFSTLRQIQVWLKGQLSVCLSKALGEARTRCPSDQYGSRWAFPPAGENGRSSGGSNGNSGGELTEFEQAAYETAYQLLHQLGIVQRRWPYNSTVTRAEYTAFMVRTLGQGSNAQLLKGSPVFADTVDHWASGEIALACSLGVSLPPGHGGSFEPERLATYGEVITGLLNLLGEGVEGTAETIDTARRRGLISEAIDIAPIWDVPARIGPTFVLLDKGMRCVPAGVSGKSLYQLLKYTRPLVQLPCPPPALTVSDQILVPGKVSLDTRYLLVNGIKEWIKNDFTFASTVKLQPGFNRLEFTALDAVGNCYSTCYVVERT